MSTSTCATVVVSSPDEDNARLQKRVAWAGQLVTPEPKQPRDDKRLPSLIELQNLQANRWCFIQAWTAFHVAGSTSFELIRPADEKKNNWQAQFHDAFILDVREQTTYVRFVPHSLLSDGKTPSGLKLCKTSESEDGHSVSYDFLTRATAVLESQWPFTKPVPQSLFEERKRPT